MRYEIIQSNPEGIDFVLKFDHDKKFSWEEFRDVAEAAFVYAFKKEKEERGNYFKGSPDMSYISEFLISKGFTFSKEEIMQYELEPYWSEDKIHSPELKALIRKETE